MVNLPLILTWDGIAIMFIQIMNLTFPIKKKIILNRPPFNSIWDQINITTTIVFLFSLNNLVNCGFLF